jgi:hypothetical protein
MDAPAAHAFDESRYAYRRTQSKVCCDCGDRRHPKALVEGRCHTCRQIADAQVRTEEYRAYLLDVLAPALEQCCEADRARILRALTMGRTVAERT